jgi:hypothetical protein
MKKILSSNAFKMTTVIIDPELNKYRHVILFPEKLKKANEILSQLSQEDKIFLEYDKSIATNDGDKIIEQADLEQPLVQENII